MIYLKNILEEQEVYIPRQDQGGEYVSPCEKCYGEGYEQGYADGSNIKLEQGDIVVTADTMTVLPSSGYSGFESVDIDATEYGQDKYDEGYGDGNSDGYASGEAAQKAKLASTAFTQNGVYTREDGWNEVEVDVADIPARVQEKTIVVTAATETVYPDSGYEGISSAYVDATAYGQSQYQSGTTHGEEVQKAKLTSTAFTQNGVYNRTDGWDEVEVIVPQSGSPCSLESGVTFPLNSGFTQTTVTPSSGYDGISDITIYDNGYGQERYDGGYTAGRASVSLESKTETITADTQTIYPSSGYDGMSSVAVDASSLCGDYYGSGWTEGYDQGQADCPSCNLQNKSVVMTATTDTFYPDQTAVADVPVIGIEIPTWDETYCIDTNIYPTSSMSIRIKYQGRGVSTDRLIGTYPDFLGVPDDDHDYRTFDAQGWVDFDILNGRFENLNAILTNSGDDYDITMSTDGVYDNINEEWIVQGDPRYYEPDTGYTICVDVGTVFVKEVIIEDNDTELFHGTPSVESGEAGLYDSISDSFFGIYSGADVSLVLYADYDGISEINVDASGIIQDSYDDGYNSGVTIGYVEGYGDATVIKYTSSDGNIVVPTNPNAFRDTNGNIIAIKSNTYSNGVGVIVFNGILAKIGISDTEAPGHSGDTWAFESCATLTSISLPNTIEWVGYETFNGCTSLRSFILPDGAILKEGMMGNFRNSGIRLAVIPDSVTVLPNDEFTECPYLNTVILGKGLTLLKHGCFSIDAQYGNQASLQTIYSYATTAPTLSTACFAGQLPNGVLYVPSGSASSYQSWLNYLPSGWTISATL